MSERPKPNWRRRAIVGTSMAALLGTAGFLDVGLAIHSISKKVEQAYPHMVSSIDIKQANGETLVFDQNMHDLDKKRRALGTELMDKRIKRISMPAEIGAFALALISSAWIIRDIRERTNATKLNNTE